MEANQKKRLKRNLIAAVLVILAAWMIFLCVKISNMEKALEVLQVQLRAQEDNNAYESADVQKNVDLKASPVPEGKVEQAVSSAIVTERPPEVTCPEPEAAHKVYLTFDDGPSKHTEKILDILDEYGVKATFFVVGREGEKNEKRLQMIYERGHTIGMHSYSHDYSEIYDSEEAFREDFLKSKQYIFQATGVETIHYRFPGGSSNALSDLSMQVFVDFLDEQGMEYYDWNVSSGDGSSILLPVEMIVDNCTSRIPKYETSIVLMHDSASKTTTLEALPQILETILAMEDTVILPITEYTVPIHHKIKEKNVKVPEPTATPELTATPKPMASPAPTATPAPTPSATEIPEQKAEQGTAMGENVPETESEKSINSNIIQKEEQQGE